MAKRRTFLETAGTIGVTGLLAGCLSSGNDGGDSDGGDSDGSDGDGSDGDSGPKYGNGEINFVMSPSEPQQKMRQQYQPVKEHLSEEIGMPTKLKYARNYSAVLQAMGSGTSDIAETGPFAAALGVRDDKCNIALQRKGYGAWTYSSVIVTKENSDIESLSDLEGKQIGFADRLSASGALYPLYMLQDAGLDIGGYPMERGSADFRGTFSGHEQAFQQLKTGQVPAVGVGKFIALNDNRELKDGYRYVETEDGIPRAPIVTSPELSDSEHDDLVNALKNAPESMYLGANGEEGGGDDLWFSDVRPASRETYEPVVNVAKSLGIETDLLDGGSS
ncbi:phosphate/phosphite/phosphonate ABC transporter substrate-binding protein [Natronoarchaeum rubrum]|uniref:phosphate/phosphite/phosphonate ABC transporter substrate-binding protein n=1 Tax=Natronoarchaeum rubrum TaxID=755311 RepID=UPI00211167AA|nr:phosphate/phosphite/phosphonate ABC transporter substrate-binding protein [Natronoarchaeum rubrum]